MATKYTRDIGDTPANRIAERLEAHRQLRAGGPFSFRPGGSGLILSLGAAIFALMLFQTTVNRMLAEPPAPAVAVGTVSAKAAADPEALGERPLLQVTIGLEDGVLREVWVPTDPESWDTVAEGDRLEVEYTLDARTGAVQVRALRAVPEVEAADPADTDATEPTEATEATEVPIEPAL